MSLPTKFTAGSSQTSKLSRIPLAGQWQAGQAVRNTVDLISCLFKNGSVQILVDACRTKKSRGLLRAGRGSSSVGKPFPRVVPSLVSPRILELARC